VAVTSGDTSHFVDSVRDVAVRLPEPSPSRRQDRRRRHAKEGGRADGLARDAASLALDVLPATRLGVITADDLFDLACRAASIIDQNDLAFL
jgi:hypothetical protein